MCNNLTIKTTHSVCHMGHVISSSLPVFLGRSLGTRLDMNTLELNKFHVFVAMAMLTTRGANDTGMGFNWKRLGLQRMLDSFGYSIDSTLFEL